MRQKIFLLLLFAIVCIATKAQKLSLYCWEGWNEGATTATTLRQTFADMKVHHVKGVCMNVGFDIEKARLASDVAKEFGLEFHAWIPCMLQQGLPDSWYAVNRKGERANRVPAYVPYYTCLDPNNPQVQQYLIDRYKAIAALPNVDYIQLDYIRYVDVILAKGLWKKYGLVMNEEYPAADYCYCNDCTAAFQRKTGIDIKAVKDPSQVKEWAQFRCDVITNFVNKLADEIHKMGKKVSADVFPGPKSHAVWMVRQEWNRWNIDAFFPMNYNDFYLQDASWLKQITHEEVKSVKGKVPIMSGLFICKDWQNKKNIIDPEFSGLLPSEIKEAIMGVKKAKAQGICLFTYSSMTPAHWQALHQALQ